MAGYIGRLEGALKAETVRARRSTLQVGIDALYGYDFGPSVEKAENNAAVGHINQRTSAKVFREMSAERFA